MARFLPKSIRVCVLGLVAVACFWRALDADFASAHEGHDHSPFALGGIYPRLSESGEQIVFSYQGAIWRMRRTGSTMIRLTSAAGFDIEPAWSADEKLIAFIRTRNLAGGPLQVIRAEDGQAVPLPRNIVVREKLHFDLEGKRVLATAPREGGGLALSWIDLQTGTVTPVADVPARARCALSPSGDIVAFATSLDVADEQSGNQGPEMDLWKASLNGGERQKITRFPARIYDLCWAADGKSLYIVTDLGGAHNDLWQVPLDDAQVGARKLTFSQGDEDAPSVSADGRWLLMTDNRHGATAFVLRDQMAHRSNMLEVTQQDFRQPTGRLMIETLDQAAKRPVTARVSIEQQDGKYHAPPGSLYRLLDNEMHFYTDSITSLNLPAGRYQVKVARGPEYRLFRQTIEIQPNQSTAVTAQLERWTDQRASGWYSGESHIHANYGYGHWYNSPYTMRAQCAGEDLIVCNFMVANSDGDGVFDREYFRGKLDPLSTSDTLLYWNEEFRSTIWGHMTLLNLQRLVEPIFTGFHHTTNPHDHPTNADVADHTHDQGGHVNYTHPAQNVKDPYLTAYSAKELPIDVALGKVDSIDVMGSNHVANMPLWYGMLNCGFRIPASAGTDCFLNRIASRLPGSDRVYVHVPGDFSYESWIQNLKAGRTFVTNGPILAFSANGQSIGETVQLGAGLEIPVTAQVTTQYPVDRLEVIFNGRVVAQATPLEGGLRGQVKELITIPHSGWLALRASGPSHPDQPRGVFAHTSPIYVAVAGKPNDPRTDAEYFLTWIDRLWAEIRRRNRIPSRHQTHVESQISAARAVYQKLAGK